MSNLNLLLLNNYIFFKLSLRELRGSFNEFKIVITSIFLGVFIISAVGSLSENLKSEINKKRTELIGGKFECHDDARIDFLNALPGEPHTVKRPGCKIFHQNVTGFDQPGEHGLACFIF